MILTPWRYKGPLILQRQPNLWSCFPTSFAIILDVPIERIIEELGHDGSEIIRPNKLEPYCYRGFHPQEFTKLCLNYGQALINFDVEPLNYNGETIIKMSSDLEYILKLMTHNVGVIGGYFKPGRLHAVAWDGRYILDPASELIYTIDEFNIETFYMIKSLEKRTNNESIPTENMESNQKEISSI